MSGLRLAALPLALLAFVALAVPALAQGRYPSRPIRVMLPFAAGSVSDVTLRVLADRLGARLNTSVVVDNQPRAGGTTAAAAVLAAARDGYSLVTLSSSTAISVSLLKGLPYDPVADFVPICGISTFANIIAVSKDSKYRTLNDLLAAMHARPGKLNFGTTTVGSTNHLAANLLKSMTGQNFLIVPFRTPGDLVTAVLRNDVDAIIQSYGALKSAVEGGQLRALASTTPARTAYAPDVPTVDEAGVKGFDVVTWNGFFAPAGTPQEVIDTLNREVRAALADPDLKQRYADLGLEPLPNTPAELGALLRAEIGKWGRVIADAGIEKQ
ncbi:MAG: tripartite tricarboxylate transporter substrate binding protein [Xanthobacteraceae bacterium]|nr:tripartite tricarboxylate transporter substrate binding protein [Xanthobacteraceae bacterium]